MTFEEIPAGVSENGEVMADRKSVNKTILAVLQRAQAEKRLTCGMIPTLKTLEMDPDNVLFCIIPQNQNDSGRHIHSVLLQAFCYENDIHMVQVDNADKLAKIISGKNCVKGRPVDSSCVLVHKHDTSLSDQEKKLVEFCDWSAESFTVPVIKLPIL